MKRPTLQQAKATYIHRFTCEHVPHWALQVRSDGTYYAPGFSSDLEWYENTLFDGESELADKNHCYTSGHSWPLGKVLDKPFNPNHLPTIGQQ